MSRTPEALRGCKEIQSKGELKTSRGKQSHRKTGVIIKLSHFISSNGKSDGGMGIIPQADLISVLAIKQAANVLITVMASKMET